ncbi:hypothetical protein EZS27_027263 [termite gut metagenome]|jgi:hypothetical protein|uniref:Uncharacterized protein n=1 Tax=termite gut metagenome TaxID=433724 RepID=A0A5J4QMY4_9ZZZZ
MGRKSINSKELNNISSINHFNHNPYLCKALEKQMYQKRPSNDTK